MAPIMLTGRQTSNTMPLAAANHLSLLTLGGNRVNLINENDGRRILLCFFKCFSQVAFRLSCQLGHDFWTVDEEEKGPSLIGHCSGNQCLTYNCRQSISAAAVLYNLSTAASQFKIVQICCLMWQKRQNCDNQSENHATLPWSQMSRLSTCW